jgi:hypothetical protein
VAGQIVNATLDFLEQVWNILVIKGQAAAEQGVQDNSTAPDVNFWPSVQLATDDLAAVQKQYR